MFWPQVLPHFMGTTAQAVAAIHVIQSLKQVKEGLKKGKVLHDI